MAAPLQNKSSVRGASGRIVAGAGCGPGGGKGPGLVSLTDFTVIFASELFAQLQAGLSEICWLPSEIPPLLLSLCDDECRSSPSYVFSSAWGRVSAHGPLIINLAVCWPFDRSSVLYLNDSDLTRSSGLCWAFFPSSYFLLLPVRFVVGNVPRERWKQTSTAPKTSQI